jgi:hypothetical protein
MVQMLTRDQIAEQAIIHPELLPAPATIRNAALDRSFELPTVLYALTAGLFLAFVGIMAAGFAHPEMIIPTAVFALFIVAFFAVPAIWVRLQPENPVRAKSWARFQAEGIQTAYGHIGAGAATAQVLVLPVLIVMWGVAAVTIAAIVG